MHIGNDIIEEKRNKIDEIDTCPGQNWSIWIILDPLFLKFCRKPEKDDFNEWYILQRNDQKNNLQSFQLFVINKRKGVLMMIKTTTAIKNGKQKQRFNWIGTNFLQTGKSTLPRIISTVDWIFGYWLVENKMEKNRSDKSKMFGHFFQHFNICRLLNAFGQ